MFSIGNLIEFSKILLRHNSCIVILFLRKVTANDQNSMLFISSLHVQYTSKNRSSYDNLCIWFEPSRYDFVRYSDMADTLPLHILNPGPSLHWKSYTEDKKCILRIYHSFCSHSNLVYSLFCTDSFHVGEWTSAPPFSLAQKILLFAKPAQIRDIYHMRDRNK